MLERYLSLLDDKTSFVVRNTVRALGESLANLMLCQLLKDSQELRRLLAK